jgi:hypothetical protein
MIGDLLSEVEKELDQAAAKAVVALVESAV